MRKTKIFGIMLTACMIGSCMAGIGITASGASFASGNGFNYEYEDSGDTENSGETEKNTKIDISDGTVTVDVANKSVTLTVNGKTVPASEYYVIYFTYEKIDDGVSLGESLTRVGTDFPTDAGTYIAAVIANSDSYTGQARSDPFTIRSSSGNSSVTRPQIVKPTYVPSGSGSATTTASDETKAPEETKVPEETGTPDTTKAPEDTTVPAGNDATQNGSNGTAVDSGRDTNPHTGVALGGLSVLTLAGAAMIIFKKKK